MSKEKKKSKVWGTLSIVMACVSLILFPPLFALLGVIFGAVGIAKEEGGLPIAGIILSLVFGTIGMVIGALMMLSLAFI